MVTHLTQAESVVVLGVDVAGGSDFIFIRRGNFSREVRVMEFAKIVVFVSDGVCPKCDEVKEVVQAAGMNGEVNIMKSVFIANHPRRNDIMVQLTEQNMQMPVVVYYDEVLSGEEFVRKIQKPEIDVFDIEGREFNEACGLERGVASEVVAASLPVMQREGICFPRYSEETIAKVDINGVEFDVYYGIKVAD